MIHHPSVRSGVRRAVVLGTIALLVFLSTLPWVMLPVGFAIYALVLAVAVVLTSRNRSPGVYMFLWVALPGSTLSWAARMFYGNPPLLSAAAVQAFALMICALATAAVLFRLPHHRAKLLFPVDEQPS